MVFANGQERIFYAGGTVPQAVRGVRAKGEWDAMERIVNLQIEKLPEGVYLATSDNVQGLVAQGKSITETIEVAKDVAKKLTNTKHALPSKTKIKF